MGEITKNDIKFVSFIALGFAMFVTFAVLVPDDSFWKNLMAVLMVATMIIIALLFTSIGNPLKKLYRNWIAKKRK